MKTTIHCPVINWATILLFLLFSYLLSSCEDYLETEDPIGQINADQVFEDEMMATAAVTSLYAKLRDEVMVTGDFYGMGCLMGLYSDELDFYGFPGSPLEAFFTHQIIPSNTVVRTIWDGAYKLIYMSNTIIDGLENSNALSEATKRQLKGEALFVRSLTHFYLVNLFGDIPYIQTTDYLINKDVARDPVALVYEHILSDLENAKILLTEEYISGERIRANKFAVHALSARIHNYLENWSQAELESSLVIAHAALYVMEPDISMEFLKESRSAILQLKPAIPGDNTHEGMVFNFISAPPFTMALSTDLINSMEQGDLRKTNWVAEISNGSSIWYASTKYKYRENTGNSMEYSIVLRLAEQYLIRAEARTKLGNLEGAKEDINAIRLRAGLPLVSTADPNELIEIILRERRIELFAEQGHRWFDLKRTGNAGQVLSIIKPSWNENHLLLPIPEVELLINPNLNPQNPGY